MLGADGEHHRLGAEVQRFGRSDEEECVVEVAAAYENVRTQLLELGDDVAKVCRTLWVGFNAQYLQAIRFRPTPRARSDTRGERAVRVCNDDRLGALGGQHLQGRLRVIPGRRQHGKQVLEPLGKDGFGGPVPLDHNLAVFLGNFGGAQGQAGGIRPQEEVHVVLGDELFHQPGRRVPISLVVVQHQLDLVAVGAHSDAAVLIVHPVQPEAVALTNVVAFPGIPTGFADGSADADDVLRVALPGELLGIESLPGDRRGR